MDTQYRRLNITLPDELLTEFEAYCEERGMSLSSRIAVLIGVDLHINVRILQRALDDLERKQQDIASKANTRTDAP